MKKLLLAVLLASGLGGSAFAGDEYHAGYKEGWEAGYLDCSGGYWAPMAPFPPMAKFGQRDWQGGFMRGNYDGHNQALKDNKGECKK